MAPTMIAEIDLHRNCRWWRGGWPAGRSSWVGRCAGGIADLAAALVLVKVAEAITIGVRAIRVRPNLIFFAIVESVPIGVGG